jgi:hypothetical protein
MTVNRTDTYFLGHVRRAMHVVHRLAAAALLAVLLSACVEESATTVVFDQLLESTTFENRLLTQVIIFRDALPIDTLEARQIGYYPIGRKGAIRHAWQILAPIDNSGNPAGVEPYEDLGVQYRVRESYVIDEDALSDKSLFTPRIVNLTPYSLRITANYATSDPFSTNYTVPANAVVPNLASPTPHAPYFYWHSSSNIRLTDTRLGRVYEVSRNDSTALGTLRLDQSSLYEGSGLTEPIVVQF